MEVNAGKCRTAEGGGTTEGALGSRWGHFGGRRRGGDPRAGGVGYCPVRIGSGSVPASPPGPLHGRPPGSLQRRSAARWLRPGPPLTWPGRASHVRAVFTFGGARAPVGWAGA